MPMQMRVSADDKRWYSPNGDIAHNFQNLLQHTFNGLDMEKALEDWYGDYARYTGVTSWDFGAAAEAMAYYLKYVNDPQIKDPKSALDEAGFFRVNSAAQLITMAKLGQILTCAYFSRARQAFGIDEANASSEDLIKYASKYSHYMLYEAGRALPFWYKSYITIKRFITNSLGVVYDYYWNRSGKSRRDSIANGSVEPDGTSDSNVSAPDAAKVEESKV